MKQRLWFTVLLVLAILVVSLPTLAEAPTALPAEESLPMARPLSGQRIRLPGEKIALELASRGGPGRVTAAPQQVQADVNLELDDGSVDTSIGIGGTSEFIYLNRFTPAPSDFAFDLNQVQVYFQGGTSNVQVGDDIRLVVYENTSGNSDPAVGSKWLASFPATVQAVDAWNTYNLVTPVHFDGPGDVLIGVIALEKPGSPYFPAAIDLTQSKRRSWAGWWNGSPPDPPNLPPGNWTLIDNASANFAGNWLIRGYGAYGTQTPRVQLEPEHQTGRGNPGDLRHYTITLRNYTGQTDSFDISHSGNAWPVSHFANVGPVANNGNTTFQVDVTIPGDAVCPECDTVVIKAQAQAGSVFSDTVTIETCVGEDWQTKTTSTQGAHWMAYTCTQSVGAQGTCFYFGGLTTDNVLTRYSQKYDIATGQWTQIRLLPTAVFGATAGTINGKIYVAGGFTGITDPWPPTGMLQIYNIAANTWSTGPVMPIPRGGTVGGAVGGKLYVANGFDPVYDYRYLHEYDPAANAWTEKEGTPAFFDFGAGTASSDRLYVGGGYGGEDGFFAYNPAANTWETLASLPGGAGKKSPVMAAAPDCSGVFLYGGDLGNWNGIQDTTWHWHPVSNAWSQYGVTLHQPTTGAGGGYAGGRLWSFGGSQGSGPISPPPHESLTYCCPPGPPVGSVAGRVTDANTGRPLLNANLYLTGITDPQFEDSTWTDGNGRYSFGPVIVADYKLRAAAYGYYSADAQVTIVKDTTLTQDFVLDAAIPELSHHAVGVDVPVDSTGLFTLTLENHGTGDLNYHISELPAGTPFGRVALPVEMSLLPWQKTGRVDPQLYADLAESANGTAKFIVYMAEQADLSEAFKIKDRSARGYFVLNALQTTAERTQAGLRSQLTKAGVEYEPRIIANALVVSGKLSLVENIAARPDVAYIEANKAIPAPKPVDSKPATEGVEGVEWNIHKVRADEVWTDPTFGTMGAGIVVASIDTGVEYNHPALVDQYRGNLGGGVFDHNYNWWDPYGYAPSVPTDFEGHGTHTMGTMVGDDGGSNQIGMAPGATWFTCEGFDPQTGFGYEDELLECAEFILAPWDLTGANPNPDRRADVVNNSWGGGQAGWWYNQAVYAWRAAGIFPSFSAGNAGPACDTTGDPGDMANVIAAGALAQNDSNAPSSGAGFSSRGPAKITGLVKPNVSAPGAGVRSSVPNHQYGSLSGTSMASPHVAGEAALIWAAQPDLRGNVQLTYSIIERSADPLLVDQGYFCGTDQAKSVPNNQYGWGRIDAYEAVSMAVHSNWDIPWLAVEPMSGTVQTGSDTAVELAFDTVGLTQGQCYNAHLKVEYNDPYITEEFVPVALCVDRCLELDGITIVGPEWLFLGHEGTYSAALTPVTATLPVTIEWSNGVTDTATTYSWATTGTYTIVVTATNCASTTVTDTLMVNVVPVHTVYLPIVYKRY